MILNQISALKKSYASAVDRFAEYCKGKKEMQKDLVALALVELMDKYK